MRFGIIGCSRVARRRFLPTLTSSPHASLFFVGSRDMEKAKAYTHEFHAKSYGSYEEVLASSDVDAVYISTPPLLHTEWALKAAHAGKHIIVEKPAFPTLAEARAALAVCKKAGVRLFENYAFLYHPQHKAARALVPRIGGITRIRVQYLYPFPPEGDIRFKPALGGGVFHDSFGYPFALALHYFGGAPKSVSCTRTFDQGRGIDTAAAVTLRFPGAKTLEGRVHMGSETYASEYTLHGPSGSIAVCRAFAVDADKPAEIVLKIKEDDKRIIVPSASQFQLALHDFCATVRGERERAFEADILARETMREAAHRVATRK